MVRLFIVLLALALVSCSRNDDEPLKFSIDRWCSPDHSLRSGNSVLSAQSLELKIYNVEKFTLDCQSKDTKMIKTMLLAGHIDLKNCPIDKNSHFEISDESGNSMVLYSNSLSEFIEVPEDFSAGVILDSKTGNSYCDVEVETEKSILARQ